MEEIQIYQKQKLMAEELENEHIDKTDITNSYFVSCIIFQLITNS